MSKVEEQQPISFNFPLFDLLINKTKDEPLTQTELINFIENVRKLDKTGFNHIFVIIRIFSIKNVPNNNSVNINDLPYSGQRIEESRLENKTDVKFDIRNFPNKLNQMLYYFTKMHLNLLTETDIENDDNKE
jgi:hypothetical protein